MQKRALILFNFILLFLLAACNREKISSSELKIICEEFRPYSYTENNTVKGIAVEIVDSILGRLGTTDQTIEITSDWEGAYEKLESENNIVLFTTIMTPDRKDKFQWAGPIILSTSGFMALTTNEVEVNNLSDAKELNSVGVVSGYATVETLEDEGFSNLVYYNSTEDVLDALYKGEIEALFNIIKPTEAIADAKGYDISRLTTIYSYSTMQGFVAFSKAISNDLVVSWQEQLDALKTIGCVQRIHEKYLPNHPKAPGFITIYTEENQPQNYRNKAGNLTGSSVETIEAMMEEIGRQESILLNNWTQAYNQTLLVPNSVIFSTARTESRETMFHWVGPLCQKSYCFFTKTGSGLSLSSLNDAKQLNAVGVPEGWASQSELEDNGFTNIKTGLTPALVFQMLMDGTVDAAVLNDIAIDYLAEELGYSSSDVQNALTLSSGQTWMAFNIDTKSEYLQEWEDAFNSVVAKGTFKAIWKKWYPDVESPNP